MKNKKMFGIEMSRGARISILIALPFTAVLLIMYVLTGFFVPKEAVYMPSGHLSESIFDVQNMTYTPVAGFNNKYRLPFIPFTVDVPNGTKATVGDAVVFYNAPYCFYYNVVTADTDICTALRNGLTSIVSIDADAADSVTQVLMSEDGFMNGCEGTFYVISLDTSDNHEETRYICAYKLCIDESIYASDYNIIIGCMSEGYTTENMGNLQKLAEKTIGTFKYNSDYAKELGIK